MKIPVRLGSKVVKLTIQPDTNCKMMIEKALKKCKIPSKPSQTSSSSNAIQSPSTLMNVKHNLFERINGIERLVSSDENIYELLINLKMSNIDQVEFVIKLCRRSDQMQKKIQNASRNSKLAYKLVNNVIDKDGRTLVKANGLNNGSMSITIQETSTNNGYASSFVKQPKCSHTEKNFFHHVISFGIKIKQQIKTKVQKTDAKITKSFGKFRRTNSPSSNSFKQLIPSETSISS